MKKIPSKNFKRLWVSHGLSQITNYLLLFVVLGRVFEITNSAIALGMIWIIYALPIFLLGPFTGTLVDCMSKRKVLVYTNILQSLVIASYALSFIWKKNYLVYALIFLYSLINQFNNPAELALVPSVVDKESLLVANNILFFTDQAAFIIGSSSSGILIRLFGPFAAVLLTAVVTFTAGANAFFLPHDSPTIKIHHWGKVIEEIAGKIKEGYEFVMSRKLILYAFGLIILHQIIVVAGSLILPVFSSQILHLTPYDASYIIALPLACGLIGGTVLLAKHHSEVRKKEWIGNGLFFLGSILIAFTVLVARMHKGGHLVAAILAFLAGLATAIAYAPTKAFIQEVTPPRIRGRVFGTLGFFITLATIPPSIFTTMLTELLGIRWFLTIIGLTLLSLGVFILRRGTDVILAANHRT